MADAIRLTAEISIHAPREGSDHRCQNGRRRRPYFYPRSPRGERLPTLVANIPEILFLSTLPARGATWPCGDGFERRDHFYPRSPRGERLGDQHMIAARKQYFYPRSPRGERPVQPLGTEVQHDFYPRSPRGERLSSPAGVAHRLIISIHAPREGSDAPG